MLPLSESHLGLDTKIKTQNPKPNKGLILPSGVLVTNAPQSNIPFFQYQSFFIVVILDYTLELLWGRRVVE